MINIHMTLSHQAEFAMPARALPKGALKGATSAAAADSKRRFLDTTSVSGYSRITDVAVLTGAFPGTSAWSPPI